MDGYPDASRKEDKAEFQKSPVRGRPNVNKLVPKRLTRSTTDDTQTAINRVVHEALHRSGTNAAAVAKDVQVAEDVKRRVELVIEAKEDELKGRITHQQRLELIRLVATLSVDETMEELSRMQQSASNDAEEKVKVDTSVAPVIWRRILCSYLLAQHDVLVLGRCCRFLRQDHALGLHSFVVPSLLEGLEDTNPALPLAAISKPMPATTLKEIVYKFRYAQTLIASRRAMRLHDNDWEFLKVAQVQRLDLSFCRNVSQEKLLSALRSCFCLHDLSLRGCTQLTSPTFEEALQYMKPLNYLDLRGCENLNTDAVVKRISDVPSLRTLRFGFECQEKLWPFGAQIPMKCLNFSSWDMTSLNLRFFELDLELVSTEHPDGQAGVKLMLDEGVLALLKVKSLDTLMLWNCHALSSTTFRAIVQRYRDVVNGVMLEDCYHAHQVYFHVIPVSWEVHDERSMDDFAAKAFPVPSTSPLRRILTAVNVARDPVPAIQTMMTPVAEFCKIEEVMLFDEYVAPPIPPLASAKVKTLELRFTPNTEQDYFRDFVSPFIKACPQLRRFRMDMGLHLNLRHLGQHYDDLLNNLAEHCQQLEELLFETPTVDEWPQRTRASYLAEYYDRGPKTTQVVTASLETVRKLLQNCRRLRQVVLLPPAAECRMSFWHLLSAMNIALPSLDLIYSDAKGSQRTSEAKDLPKLIETMACQKISVNYGMTLTPPICDAMLLHSLRSLRVERIPVEDVDAFYQMFVKLPERSPYLEELALGHLTISDTNELDFLDSLRGFRHLTLLQLKDLDGEVEALNKSLPQVVQQNRRTLTTLKFGELDYKILLSSIAGCCNLRWLEVKCLDFPGTELQMTMKVIARCPKLERLDMVVRSFLPDDGPSANTLQRQILQLGRGLWICGSANVDFFRGLQYNDGAEDDPNRRDSDDDDSDSDD